MHHIMECITKFQALNQQLENIKQEVIKKIPDRIITPIENTWDNFFLNGPAVTDDFMNERGLQKLAKRESL